MSVLTVRSLAFLRAAPLSLRAARSRPLLPPPLVLLPPAITQQIEHKLLKRGFQFNVIVVGQSPLGFLCVVSRVSRIAEPETRDGRTGQTGLGKSTLINTLFASHLIDSKGRLEAEEETRSTTEIVANSHGALPLGLSSGWAEGRTRSPPPFPSCAALQKLRT